MFGASGKKIRLVLANMGSQPFRPHKRAQDIAFQINAFDSCDQVGACAFLVRVMIGLQLTGLEQQVEIK